MASRTTCPRPLATGLIGIIGAGASTQPVAGKRLRFRTYTVQGSGGQVVPTLHTV